MPKPGPKAEAWVPGPTSPELAQAQLAAIVESSDDAIISKTLDGIITSWNRGAQMIFGFTAAEAVGKSITMIIPDDRRAEEIDVLARLRRGEKIDHFETVRRSKDGRHIDISLTVSPIRNEAGTIIGASKVARDITDRKHAEQERQSWLDRAHRARQVAERAVQMRDEFLATVSHELRSPLNAIVGWAQVLRMGGLDAERTRRAIDAITRNATIQDQMISDVLDMQRLASGQFRLQVADVDLPLLIEEAFDAVRPAAQAKSVTLTPSIAAADHHVKGDGNRLKQVVWNLLSNAVKFVPNGGTVLVHLRDVESGIELAVEDDGPGIRPDFLPHVFDRFRQDSASPERRAGLGLGLAIVKNLVELHGGTVTARNREAGTGAILTVRLPRVSQRSGALAESSADDLEYSAKALPSLRGTRVLVVDDEPEAREMIAALLGRCDAEVTVAGSAEEALALLARCRPHVIVADIGLPELDGYALLRAIRALPEPEGGLTPAVAVTAAATTEDRLRALRAGFQFHVPKPVQPAELAAVVASLAGLANP